MNFLKFPVLLCAVVILVCCCCAVAVAEDAENDADNAPVLNEPWQISRKFSTKSLFSKLGVVSEIRPCGGPGKVYQVRSEACTTNVHPCIVPTGEFFRGEISFIPETSAKSLGVRAIYFDSTANDEKLGELNQSNVSNGKIVAGKPYVLTVGGKFTDDYKGKVIKAQIQIINDDNKQVEACVETDWLAV